MTGNLSDEGNLLARLVSPVRNRYFYGKMLTERDLTLEQTYLNRKRWLVNRLGLGSGVLCGLEVETSQDGQCVMVHPGVAIDPLGREIVVPEPYCLTNPRQMTDCLGNPLGDPIKGAAKVTLCLKYRECEAEPVPVLVSDCDTHEGCAANVVRERYCLMVSAGLDQPEGDGIPCAKIFPVHPNKEFDHSLQAAKALSGECQVPSTECVVLADLILSEKDETPVKVDMFAHRQMIYSNEMLFDLLICLADRVDQCCQVKLLRYVSGDAQKAAPNEVLKEPLVVQVVDDAQKPVANEAITFTVRGGGGAIQGGSGLSSDSQGMAKVSWQLGKDAGLNTVEARLANGANVMFVAMAMEAPAAKPPVILATQPANGEVLKLDDVNKLLDRGLEIVFDQPMDVKCLNTPEKWLGLYLVNGQKQDAGDAIALVDRLQLTYIDHDNGQPTAKAIYRLAVPESYPNGLMKQRLRVLIVAFGKNKTILSAQTKLLLDGEFAGTQLNFSLTGLFPNDPALDLLTALFGMGPGQREKFGLDVYKGLSSPAAAPAIPANGTGDTQPGGLFHSYFGIA